jgi:hypothetical protein
VLSPHTIAGAALLAVLTVALGACGRVAAPVPAAASLPLDLKPAVADLMACGALGVTVIREKLVDFTGDGATDAVVAARCSAGAGNPPSAVFAVAATAGGAPAPERLLDPAGGDVLKEIRSTGTELALVTYGYSAGAPRCCPDLQKTLRFHWDGSRVVPGAVTRAPLVAAAR